MASLPSYHEAVARPHWLDVAAPYVRFADYHALCLVSRRCWAVFAPRLWGNLLVAARLRGLDPGDGTCSPYVQTLTRSPADTGSQT